MTEPLLPEPLHDRAIVAVGHQYEIQGEIGRGGMSVVYRARDTRLNRAVAIKVLPPELAYDVAVRTRFMREAQTAAQLAHPHIVPIYDVGERDGLAYLVMALVEGGSLAALLAQEPEQPVEEVRRILREVSDALAYAHGRGVIHRDIKPDNILLDAESGRAIVTDFGIARAIEAGTTRLTVTGVAVGTPAFMSPEQAVGEREIDGRSDLYSLGVVGYQMLTGRVPFSAGNSMALLLKHVTEQPRPIADLRPDAPRPLREAVERALLKNPEDRWPTAAAFRDALTGAAASAPWRQDRREPVRYTSPRPDAGTRRSTRDGAASGRSDSAAGPVRAVSPQGGSRAAADIAPNVPPSVAATVANGVTIVPEHLAALTAEQRGDLRLWHGRVDLRDRIKAARGYAWLTVAATVTATVAFVGGLSEGIPPAVFAPAVPIYMWIKLWRRGKSLEARGLRLRRVFLSPLARWVLPAEAASAGERELEALAPREVLDGAQGAAIRRAVAERAAVRAIVSELSESDRALLPDLAPTTDLLVERVTHLARAVHALDATVDPREAESLDARIAELERSESLPGREQQLAQLRRQRERLDDLARRRAELLRQLESAGLGLASLRLDLASLRASGSPSAIADLSAATQEARALSREIGVVLEATEEAGRL